MGWGADAFSSPKQSIAEAELAMGAQFESYAVYSNIDRPQQLSSKKSQYARAEHALIYLNINSRVIGRTGRLVPICWTAIAAGNRDWQFHLWTQAILSYHYSNMVITFNHEPMWASIHQPKCSPTYDNPTTYKLAYNHVRNLFIADGVDAPWAYVMTRRPSRSWSERSGP